MAILYQGAEAVISLENAAGDQFVLKKRIPKGYRIKQLDEKIRKQRTRLESSLLSRAKRFGVSVPQILETTDFEIKMEFIPGQRIKDILEKMGKKERAVLYEQIGESIASLHAAGIMHGDLTTSNMILKNDRLFLIDFGLSKNSKRAEDFAVDLFLLYEALKAGHVALCEEGWQSILNAYKSKYPHARGVLEQWEKIRLRRRYRGGE